MKKSHLLGAVCAFSFVATSHAAVLNPISGVDIGGTLYDVTFHDSVGDSFNALCYCNYDGVFGGGSSVFATAPAFWGDLPSALAARDAIIAALGTTDTTTTLSTSDSFLIPYGTDSTGETPLLVPYMTAFIWVAIDESISLPTDAGSLSRVTDTEFSTLAPFASFSVVVPVPATVWLFGSGLLGLIGLAKHRVTA